MEKLLERALLACGGVVSELGRRTGCYPSTVSQWIHGHRRPTLPNMIKLAEIAGESPSAALDAWRSRKEVA